MIEKEDLRVTRTKKALADAFIKLLHEKPFDEITVNELCDTAGIRRATFYKHFEDKYHFLTEYTHSLRYKFEKGIWKSKKPGATKDYYVAYAKSLVRYISEYPVAVDNIFKSSLYHTFMAIVIDQNYRDTCERLRQSVAAGMQLSASVEIVASMCAGGVATTIYNWYQSGRQMSPDVLAEQIGTVVAAAIEQK